MKTLNMFKKSCLIISALFLVFQPRAFSMSQYGTESLTDAHIYGDTHVSNQYETESLTEQEKEEVELALSVVNILSEYKVAIVNGSRVAAIVALVSAFFPLSKTDSIRKTIEASSKIKLTDKALIDTAWKNGSYRKAFKQFLLRVMGAVSLAALSTVFDVFIPTDVEAATMGEYYLNGLLDMGKVSEFEKLSEDEQRFYIGANPGLRERLLSIRENIVDSMNEELSRLEEQEQG